MTRVWLETLSSLFAATTFSPPRRGCEGESAGASLVEDEMAHVFVIGAAAGAVGSIVGASANRDARARPTSARLFVTSLGSSPSRKRQDGVVSPRLPPETTTTRREPSLSSEWLQSAFLEHPPRRVASLTASAPPPRPVPAVSSRSENAPSSRKPTTTVKIKKKAGAKKLDADGFTTRRPPRSSPSAKPRRRLASPASRRCSRSSPRSSRRRSRKPRRA